MPSITPQLHLAGAGHHLLRVDFQGHSSGPVSRATAGLSQRYPPIARYGVFGVSTWPIVCDTPSPFLSASPLKSMRSRGAIPPPSKGYLSDTCARPYENKENACDTPSAIPSRKGIARYGGISRTGPLRRPSSKVNYLYEIEVTLPNSLHGFWKDPVPY